MKAVYQSLAELLNKEKEFLQYVDTQIAKYIAEKPDFRKDYFLVRKIEFLKAIGKDGEISKLIQQNLDVVEIRKGEVESAILIKVLISFLEIYQNLFKKQNPLYERVLLFAGYEGQFSNLFKEELLKIIDFSDNCHFNHN